MKSSLSIHLYLLLWENKTDDSYVIFQALFSHEKYILATCFNKFFTFDEYFQLFFVHCNCYIFLD